ncbi:hypothetical protein [Streptomyces sp. NPDC056661]|uniref:hypothetical protein n=1 Tax=Streptomyces sp. NPDC056661 TaxID=3345898 RepID=UPI0036BF294B
MSTTTPEGLPPGAVVEVIAQAVESLHQGKRYVDGDSGGVINPYAVAVAEALLDRERR